MSSQKLLSSHNTDIWNYANKKVVAQNAHAPFIYNGCVYPHVKAVRSTLLSRLRDTMLYNYSLHFLLIRKKNPCILPQIWNHPDVLCEVLQTREGLDDTDLDLPEFNPK